MTIDRGRRIDLGSLVSPGDGGDATADEAGGLINRRVLAAVGAVSIASALGLWALASEFAPGYPAPGRYEITIAPGIRPIQTVERVAAIARAYLDAQTPELAAPELHEPSIVLSEWATPARDAAQREPAVPPDAVVRQPDRIVWVVAVSGDFLNLSDLPWSRRGTPDLSGNIVIDDASGTILGVYPHDPPGVDPHDPQGSDPRGPAEP